MSRARFPIAGQAKSEWRGIAGLLGLVLAGVAIEALLPWPLKLIVDHVLPGVPLPPVADWVAGLPGGTSEAGRLAWLAFATVAVFAIGQGVQLVRAFLQADVAARMQYRLAGTLFAHLQSLSLAYHGRAQKGDLVRRVALDTGCVPALLTGVLLPLITSVITLLTLFVIMWHMDSVLATVAAGVAVPLAALLRLLGPRMTERAYAQQRLEGEVWTVTERVLSALPVVQAFGREAHEERRFKGVTTRTMYAYMHTIASQLQFKLGVDGIVALGTAAVMVIGGFHVLRGAASLGTLVVFLSYLTALYAPLLALAYLSSMFAAAAGSARRVMEVLDVDDAVREAPDARPLPPVAARRAGHVRLEGVTFGYEPGRPVLHDVDLEARPGETIALVGATGSGKSTLVSLIPRLFDPCTGCVRLEGRDLRTATLASVRERVALLLQDPFLLPMSVADNIAYGRPAASRAAVVAAAQAASADEFVRRLPRGYDEVVGERGVTLSVGQRQRIAIARALLKDAPVLVLDEPTAALDAQTEAKVMDAIARLARGRTTFVIAHRLSTVRKADRIIVIDAGRIAEQGTHAQLLARGGLYRRLHAAMDIHAVGRTADTDRNSEAG
jgi:ATP-binding cassette subfamily B protein/subfamily B ATP-binding cassette protein MsbA